MKIIWYNSESKKYNCGSSQDFISEVSQVNEPSSLAIVMKFNQHSTNLARKVLRQLNLVNHEMEEYLASS
ncbi:MULTISPECIES: hypothetical protein [Reichenbachiella]|uniref:Uncharacterized protein n=1 Tax=Reichenbachiella agariperforans TaxID=156994 RepID=A0A1M6N9E3_REIAG|nr:MULTISPECIES: hypothetical protein [Reichenbachiella]RJE71953.1 hypothetical protein BGP76_07675 [Reichenbachiella sp. MSK19-1]SHJ92267.1 hypothetical protein SAMN04488028_102158 [Reichenbachiella agariperforans]